MKHVGLILARSGSQSIADKNILPINGLPLIGYSLKVLIQCQFLQEIWVSTNDQEIARVSQSLASQVKIHLRPQSISSVKSSSLDSVLDFLETHPDCDIIYLIQCTSPCLKKCYLLEGYNLMESGNFDSVFSVTRSHHLRWTNSEGALRAINFDPRHRPRRQDWPGELVESGHFYIASRKLILEGNLLQSGCRSQIVEIPGYMSLELDEPWQIPFIEVMLKNYYETE